MAALEIEPTAVHRQLERVLASANFARSERLSRFLRFVVEQHLDGKDGELKESVIALEVFGNRDYDSRQDSTVRTEAGRLRARLAEYYVAEGSGDQVIIDLPKGGYVPLIRRVEKPPDLEKTPSRRRWLLVALAGSAVALAAVGWWRAQQTATPIAIAVLPLENLSHDPTSDYFADGLTDEIIRNLSIIDGLSPRSRTSSFAFKGKPRNVREAGKELAADYILEGSVLRFGQKLRINVQLIRARDDFPIWSAKFDRESADVFVIQDEISRGIVNSLRLKLWRGRRRYETSLEAYDLYLRARALEIQGGPARFKKSAGLFEEAIAKDPSFAPAYAGVAAAYAYLSGTTPNLDRREDVLGEMRTAAEKAIKLDPLLADGHDALGMAYARDGNWEQSEKSFRRAIELDPNRSLSYWHFGMYFLIVLGRVEEAIRQFRVAEKTDPLSPDVQYSLAYGLTSAGQYDEAAAHCEKLPESYQARGECLGRARVGQGRVGEAIQLLATAANRGYLGYAYARAGRREEAEKIVVEVRAQAFNEALALAGLGDKERTLEALERMAGLGPVRIGRALTFPEFAFVRGDPRMKALRKKVGLPE